MDKNQMNHSHARSSHASRKYSKQQMTYLALGSLMTSNDFGASLLMQNLDFLDENLD